MVRFGKTYFAAFAHLLGASPFQAGILATLPLLVGAVFQLLVSAFARRVGDKPWVVASATLQGCTFLPILMLVGSDGERAYERLLLLVCVYWILALGITPGWNAWMGRLIPSLVRSRYFARRNVSIHLTLFLSVVAAGFLIQAGEASPWGAASGFVASFMIAASCRFGSAWFLSRQIDPRERVHETPQPLREVLAEFPRRPYGRLILLLVLVNASVNVSAAYFTPFMLKALDLSYARFTILTGMIVVSRVLASAYWGEIARSYGNRRALQVAATLIVPLSGFWILSDNFAYLVALQLFAGFAWSGMELTIFLNFFDCTEERNRAQVLSIYNLLNGFAIVAGSFLGGTVLRHLGDDGYHVIFLLSSTLRACSLVLLGRGVGRRRRGIEHSYRDVFLRVMTLRPGEGPDDRPLVLPRR
jgi:MFS family permease